MGIVIGSFISRWYESTCVHELGFSNKFVDTVIDLLVSRTIMIYLIIFEGTLIDSQTMGYRNTCVCSY